MSIVADEQSKTPVTVILSEPGEDVELKAMAWIASVLSALNGGQQARIIEYLRQRFIPGARS